MLKILKPTVQTSFAIHTFKKSFKIKNMLITTDVVLSPCNILIVHSVLLMFYTVTNVCNQRYKGFWLYVIFLYQCNNSNAVKAFSNKEGQLLEKRILSSKMSGSKLTFNVKEWNILFYDFHHHLCSKTRLTVWMCK